MHQKVNPSLETAVNLGWTASKNETTFGVGCKYALDKDAFVRAKVNNSSQVGLGYQQKLREGKSSQKFWQILDKSFDPNAELISLFTLGVTLCLSTLIDGKNFQQGGHKIGMSLELEA